MSQPSDFAAAAQAFAAAVAASCPDPGSAVNTLISLLAVPSPNPMGADTAMQVVQSTVSDVMRRAVLVAICRLSAQYQPSSSNDARQLLTQLVGLLDAEIEIAGDQAEDATYAALRSLRSSVVQDLSARGGKLAALSNVSLGAAMPALTLAQRLYADPSRADQLVTMVNPVHPLFMPLQFQALSS